MADNSVSKKFCIFLLQTKSVVFFLSAPVFQSNDQIDILCFSYALYTEHRLYIHDSDTTQLDKMSCDIRCRTNQCIVTDFADLNHIIRHKTMSTLDQFKSCFALTDSTFSHDQNSDTIYVNKHSMNGNARSKFYIKPTDQFSHKGGCLLTCTEYRNIIFLSNLNEAFIRLKFIAENNTWYFMFQKFLINLNSFLVFQSLQIGTLYIPYNLYTIQIKMIEKSCQLKCRSVHIRNKNFTFCDIHFRSEIFQIHLFNDIG